MQMDTHFTKKVYNAIVYKKITESFRPAPTLVVARTVGELAVVC